MTGVRILVAVVTATVAAAVVAAVILLGPPSRQREQRIDARRVQDLMEVEQMVTTYWGRHKSLPPDMVTLSREPGFRTPNDPERNTPYELAITGSNAYRLCAVFARDSSEEPPSWNGYGGRIAWAHGSGRQCFDLKPPQDEGPAK